MTTKITYEYDAAGYLVKENIDIGNDDSIDAITNHTIAITQEFDVVTYETYQYDGYGHLLGRTNFEFDSDSPRMEICMYDAAGKPLYWQYDDDGNGQPEIVITYEYDEANRLITVTTDGDEFSYDNRPDGIPDSIVTYDYDAYGDLKIPYNWKSYGTIDPNSNDPNYEYDENGNLIKINDPHVVYWFYNQVASQTDYDLDGQIDKIATHNYTVKLTTRNYYFHFDNDDASVILETSDIDTNLDGSFDQSITYIYDAEGQLFTENHDTNLDGIIDDVLCHQYDTNGVLNQSFFDRGNDGTVDQIYTHFYDASGQREMTLIEDFATDAISNGKQKGSSGNDFFQGGTGRDRVFGEAGDDVIWGGDGGDYIDGGAGDDLARGGRGDDSLYGQNGDDVLFGGAGNDFLDGDFGRDRLDGGEGNDKLKGGNDDDVLNGGFGNDLLFGESGNDTLDGDAGDDILQGGDGNDLLRGGFGDDRLYGQSGADTFILALGEGSDLILDFEIGIDQIGLAGGIDFDDQLGVSQVGADTAIHDLTTGTLLVTLHAINASDLGYSWIIAV